MTFKINIPSLKKTITASKKELLSDALINAGIPLSLYCSKRGICGKCFIQIQKGKSPPPSEKEIDFINQDQRDKHSRLACSLQVLNDLTISIPSQSFLTGIPVLTTGIKSIIEIDPVVKKHVFPLPQIQKRSSLKDSLINVIKFQLKNDSLCISLDLNNIAADKEFLSSDKFTAVLYEDKEILDIDPGDTSAEIYGLAIDIGTTTLALELIDMISGQTIDSSTALNPQVQFGWDIISRIGYACSSAENLEELKKSVIQMLNTMIRDLLKKNKIDPGFLYDIVVSGNTVMNHLFIGKPVFGLASFPFNLTFTLLSALPATFLGLAFSLKTRVYVSPNIRSFVGGDISAGLVASGFLLKEGNGLYIDLGTNGELVLKTENKILTTSTAAGPAFEGMNISSGMLALPGAISKAEFDKELKLETIGNKPPSGICGTGLIDLIAIFLEQGKIDSSGKITGSKKELHISPEISISQNDIRELQLAKSAIMTGIKLILNEVNLTEKDIDNLVIAGAFGAHLNIENSIKIGLLPDLSSEKIIFIGNGSLAGSKSMLLSTKSRQIASSYKKNIKYTSLAEKTSFQDMFIKNLSFQSE